MNTQSIINKREIKGICIHETNNRLSEEENAYLFNSELHHSINYIVGKNKTIQMIPDDEITYHSGKANDFGNTNCISIEICYDSIDEAVVLIKSLMIKYELNTQDIYFHNDFDEVRYCPSNILRIYGNKNNFIRKELM